MDYEKWVDTEVRQTLKEEVSKEIERRKAKKAATPPSPYEFNPEEDDSFTYGPNEKPVRDVDEANQLRDHAEKEDAQESTLSPSFYCIIEPCKRKELILLLQIKSPNTANFTRLLGTMTSKAFKVHNKQNPVILFVLQTS